MTAKQLYAKTAQAIDKVMTRKVSIWASFSVLFLIKFLYILLAVWNLGGKFYDGIGSYQIDFVWWKELIATVMFAAVTWWHLRRPIPQKMMQMVVRFLFVLYYIPLNSAFALNNMDFGFFLLSNVYAVLLGVGTYFACAWCSRRTAIPRHGKPMDQTAGTNPYIRLFCAAVCVLFVIHKLTYNGLHFSLSISYLDVYADRGAYNAYLEQISGTLWGYALSLLKNVAAFLMPFYLLTSLNTRRWWDAALALLAMLSLFSVSAGKGTLFLIVLVVAMCIGEKLGLLKNVERLFTLGVALLLLWCVVETVAFSSPPLYTVLVRRQMYMPAWLNTIYYDYFSEHAKVLWTQDVFLVKNLLKSVAVYDTSPLYIISRECFGGAVPSPNTGLFAEAYMQFGAFGVVLYPALLSALFAFVGWVYARCEFPAQVLIGFQIVTKLTNVPALRTDAVLSWILFTVVLGALLWIPQRFWPKGRRLLCKR